MSAYATLSDFMKLWTQSTQTAERKLKKFLLTGLDKMGQQQSDVLSKIKVGEPIQTPVIRWMEELAYPTAVTGLWAAATTDGFTVSGNLFGVAATWENMNKVLRVGTILERQSDGVQIKVSAIHASPTLTVTAATYGSTTSTDYDVGAVTWEIISEAWSDFKDADSTRSLDRTFREVGTQIHAETFEIPKTRKNTAYELVGDETAHQIEELLTKMRRQIAYSVLRSLPYYSGGYQFGNQTEESTMLGLCNWPKVTQAEAANTDVYVNASSAEITKQMLDDLALNMWLTEYSDFNQGDWWIICHPRVQSFIHDLDISFREMAYSSKKIGAAVDTFDSKIGKRLPIIADMYMRPDVLMICDLSKVSYGYYKDDELDRKELATQGRYQRWLISFQTYGTVVRKPRQSIGMIYGLATTM